MTQAEASCFLSNPELVNLSPPEDLKVYPETPPPRMSVVPDLPGAGGGRMHEGYTPTYCNLTITSGFFEPYEMAALVDTGSSISLIDATILSDTISTPFKSGSVYLNGIGSSRAFGYVTLTFTIKGWDDQGKHWLVFRHDFYVVHTLKPGIILGSEWLHGHDVELRLRASTAKIPVAETVVTWNIWTLKGFREEWDKEWERISPSSHVVCTSFTRIPAQHHVWVPIRWEPAAPTPTDYVTEAAAWVSEPDLSSGLTSEAGVTGFLIQSAILSTADKHILVCNPSSQPAFLTPDMPLTVGHLLSGPLAITGTSFVIQTSPSCYSLEAKSELTPDNSSAADQEIDCKPLDTREDIDYFGKGARPDDSDSTLVDNIFQIGNQGGEPPPEIVKLLRERVQAFSLDGKPGLLRGARMTIPVENEALLRAEPARRTSPAKRELIRKTVDQLLQMDIIEPSSSRISSPVVMVNQNGKLRFCVDYRSLNVATKDDQYPLPRADDIFDAFAGAAIFSSLDMVKAYHQADLAEEDRWKTAFACDKGLFQYKRVPFGLKGAPAFFQRCMDTLLASMRWSEALVYLDDIIVFSKSLAEHVSSLTKLLDIVIQSNMKLDPKKCHFAFRGLKVLGRYISVDGVSILENRAQAIKDLKPPSTLSGLWHALGLWNYYRAHIPHFSAKVAPLQQLTEGIRWEGKGMMIDKKGAKVSARNIGVDWNEDRLRCFHQMNQEIANLTTLAFPMEGRKYFLYVDASQEHFAAALHQQHLRLVRPGNQQATTLAVLVDLNDSTLEDLSKAQGEDPVWAQAVRACKKGTVPRGYSWQDGVLIKASDDTACLPRKLFLQVFEKAHAGHPGMKRTLDKVAEEWNHPHLAEAVYSFVKHCATCLRTKPLRPSGSLAEEEDHCGVPFSTISVDIMMGLPKTADGWDACLIVLDTFTKTVLFRPLKTTSKAAAVIRAIEDSVLRQGWQPSRIISDHDSKFIGTLGQGLADKLGAHLTPSAPYHQQANPVERYVQTATQCLRALCLDKDDRNWVDVLPSLELALNTTPSTVTGYSAHDLLYVHRPRLLERLARHRGVASLEEQALFSQARVEQAREATRKARDAQKLRFDARKAALPELKPGDAVMVKLDKRPLLADRTRSKLQAAKEGPFRVKEVLSPHRVKLDLPDDMGGKDTWDVSQLEPLPPDDEYGRPGLRPETSGISWWEPERIVDERLFRGKKKQYRVKWKDSSRLTWVDETTLLEDQCFDLINEFKEDLPVATIEEINEDGFVTPPLEDRPDQWTLQQLSEREADVNVADPSFPSDDPSQGGDDLTDQNISTLVPYFASEAEALDRHPVHRPQHVNIAGKLYLLFERPVAFSSKKTSRSEKKLLGAELEMKGLRWAFFFFRIYLEGSKVAVVTDHLPIQGMLTAKSHRQFTPLIERVRQDLQPFIHNWSFHHKQGKTHTNVDALSRLQQVSEAEKEDSDAETSASAEALPAAASSHQTESTTSLPNEGPSSPRESGPHLHAGPASGSPPAVSKVSPDRPLVAQRAQQDLAALLSSLLSPSTNSPPATSLTPQNQAEGGKGGGGMC